MGGGPDGSHCLQKGLRDAKLVGGAPAQCFIIKIELTAHTEQVTAPFHMEGWLAGDCCPLMPFYEAVRSVRWAADKAWQASPRDQAVRSVYVP